MYVVLSVESKVTTTESIKECITTKVIEGENRKILKITQSKERPENRGFERNKCWEMDMNVKDHTFEKL